ncbi:MAG: phytoene desaturase family protein [Dehalococcoidia bacterium]
MEPLVKEFPQESEWDVVIIGAGHNGLIAGAYLARAGLKVAMVERRYEIGGGLVTEELLFPGHYSNLHAIYHMMVDYCPVFSDFNLDRHALVFIKPNSQTAMIFDDGSSLVLARMLEDTKDALAKFSLKDAATFGKLMKTWRRVVDEIVAPATYTPAVAPMELTIAMERTDIGKVVLEMTEQSPLEIINDLFENDRVRALMLYVSCMWGLDPRESGIGFFVPLLLVQGLNKCYCYGGSHKFAGSLAREVVENGGIILDNAEAVKIFFDNGQVAGVRTAEGRILKSKVVMSSLDPHSTFFDLVGREHLPEGLADSIQQWKWDKWSFYTVHVASEERPIYKADDPWANESFMVIFGIEGTDQLLAHWDKVMAGDVGEDFGGHSTCESFFDPHLVRIPGGQVSFFQMHAPYDIAGGWEARGKQLEEAALAKWQRVAPNFTRDKFRIVRHETPVDIETRFPNMRRGSFKHGDYNPLQLGFFRPNPECSSSATPIEGLYLCGASCYPGALITGGPGYIAANRVAEDLGVKKWWTPPAHVQRYLETYFPSSKSLGQHSVR